MGKYKTLFHGTTLDNFNKIIENNFQGKNDFSWYCSNDNNMYFFDLDKTDEDENEDYKKEECIRNAFESAQLTASISNYMKNELVVIEVVVPKNICEDDFSCENMENRATQVNIEDLDLSMIKKVHFCKSGYIPSLRLIYCASLLSNNEHINKDNFSNIEIEVAEKLSFEYFDELHEFDYYTEEKEYTSLTA